MKIFACFLPFILAAYWASLSASDTPIKGNGKATTEKKPLAGTFTEIKSSGVAHVIYSQADTKALTITADENLLPYIITELIGSTLRIRLEEGVNIKPKTRIEVQVSSPKLKEILLSGVGSFENTDSLQLKSLSVKLSGTGKVILNGSFLDLDIRLSGTGSSILKGYTEQLNIRISGVGSCHAEGLQSKKCEVRVSGVGNADVWATNELEAKLSGIGSISYKGNPRHTNLRTTGMGHIRQKD